MNPLVYFSSSSENTHRFVEKLGLPAIRIPIAGARSKLLMEHPFILIVPSYGGGSAVGAVPIQVIRFQRSAKPFIPARRHRRREHQLRRGVRHRRRHHRQKMPGAFLYRFELLGTTQDVENVRTGVTAFWQRQN